MVEALRRVLTEYIARIRDAGANPRQFLIGVFVFGVGQSVFQLLFNLYLRSFGYGDAFIGQILSKASLGAAIAALPAAFLFQRFPPRNLLVASGVVTAGSYVLLGALRLPELLLLVSFASGMVLTVFRLSVAPVVMREAPQDSRAHLFSASYGTFFFSAIIGSGVGGILPHVFHAVTELDARALRFSLFVAAGLALASVIPFRRMTPAARPPSGSPDGGARNPLGTLRDLVEIDWVLHAKLLVPALLIGLGAGLIIPFLNLYFRDRFGLEAAAIGVLFAVMQGFMVVGNLFGPAVSRRMGLVRGVVATQLASVPFMVALAASHSLPLVALSFCMRSALMNMNQPLSTHFAMEMVPERDHAVTNSLLSLVWFVAWSVSADIGGALIERQGYTLPLLVAAGLYVAASLLYWIFFRRVEERRVPRGEVEMPDA